MDYMRSFLYFKNSDYESVVAFLSVYEEIKIIKMSSNLIEIQSDPYQETIDLNHLREMAMQEIYQDFTAFIMPESTWFDSDLIINILHKITPGVYTIELMIPEIIMLHFTDVKTSLKDYYFNLCGHETIETVIRFIESDLNASKAAKNLFMHRNTLNYRLDHFTSLTKIDVRTFSGAYAIYLLFRS